MMRWVIVLVLLCVGVVAAQTIIVSKNQITPPALIFGPTVLFSDLTDGPITGWDESATVGAAVTIWGVQWGARDSGTKITACGQDIVSTDTTAIPQWAATGNLTNTGNVVDDYTVARGLLMTTFHLNSAMSTGAGTITVTTSVGTSEALPFNCRALGTNKIYFFSRTGNDTHGGISPAFVSGTDGPWKLAGHVRDLAAGDVAYFRTGTWDEVDEYVSINGSPWGGNNYVLDFWSQDHANGVVDSSITVTAYPGEYPQWGDTPTSRTAVFGHHGSSTTDALNYWTFAKMRWRADIGITNQGGADDPMSKDEVRFIGLDMSTNNPNGKTIFQLSGGQNGSTDIDVIGNHLHDASSNTRGQTQGKAGYGFYVTGNGDMSEIDVAYNEMAWMAGGGPNARCMQVYGHVNNDIVDEIRIYGNWFHDCGSTGIILNGGDGAPAYSYVTDLYFYNNLMTNTNLEQGHSGIFVGDTGVGGAGGNFYIHNNTFYKDYYEISLDITDVGGPTILQLRNNIWYTDNAYCIQDCDCVGGAFVSDCSSSSYNLWFGAGAGPTWDTNAIDNTDPGFASSMPIEIADWELAAGSPAINAAISSAYATHDFYGRLRPVGNEDMGAFEAE